MRRSEAAGRRRLALWAAPAVVLAACSFDFDRTWYDPLPGRDAQREPRGADFLAAPPDAGVAPDAPAGDSGPAPAVDAASAPPSVCLWSVEGAKKASCPTGLTPIAGGGDCYPTVLKSTRPEGDGWRVECQGNQSPAFTDVICAAGGPWRKVTAKGGTGVAVVAGCGAGEVLVGAGCECSAGMLPVLHRTDRAASGDRWECICGDFLPVADTKAFAVCTDEATARALGVTVADRRGPLGVDETLPCSAGAIIGGGCGTGLLVGSFADLDRNRWFCSFTEGAAAGSMSATCVTAGLRICPKP